VRVDPRTLTWLSAERLTTGPGADVAAVLSRDGSRTAFTTESASVRLWAFPLDSRSNRLGSGKPLTEAEAIVSNSALSPDGQFVLYNLSRPGMRERSELWMTRVLDNSSELVTTNAIAGCWSPDSRMLAYVRFSSSESRLAIRELRGKERFVGQPFNAMFVPPTGVQTGNFSVPPVQAEMLYWHSGPWLIRGRAGLSRFFSPHPECSSGRRASHRTGAG
jgi:WD40-like Beta Propeller Repeat